MNTNAQNWTKEMLDELNEVESENPAEIGVMVINNKVVIIDITDDDVPEIATEIVDDSDVTTATAIAWAKLTEQDIPDSVLYGYGDEDDDDDDDVTTLYDTECGDRVIIGGIVHVVCECDGEDILCVNLNNGEKEYYDIDTECEII